MSGLKKKEKQSIAELRKKEKLRKKAESEEVNNFCDGDICDAQSFQLNSQVHRGIGPHNGSPVGSLSPQIQAMSESQKDMFKEFSEKIKEDIDVIRDLIRKELEPIKKELNSLESSIKDLSLMNEGKIDHFYFYFNDNDLIFKIRTPELKTMIYNQVNALTEDTTIKGYYYHSSDKTVKSVNVRVIITDKTITIDPIGEFPKLKGGYYTLFTK